jgi:FAD/FMN-containing dehydrogenase
MFTVTDGIRSWSRIERPIQHLFEADHSTDIVKAASIARRQSMSALAIGLGRSYGDSGQNLGNAVIRTNNVNRVLSFDRTTGLLRAEAGLSISDLISRVLPYGWFVPTTPGSRFVTLGGAVANDVHGKNHHSMGTFGSSVKRIGLFRSEEGVIEVGPQDRCELFCATIGGLGLTGIILWVELQLVPVKGAYLEEETLAFENLEGYFRLAAESDRDFEHTVAWVDCTSKGSSLGRGLFTRANWSADPTRKLHNDGFLVSMPLDAPNWALNPITLKLFNMAYHRMGKSKAGIRSSHYSSTFYPLDAIGQWNRLYGQRGFFQYQSVVPSAVALSATREMLTLIASSGQGSFLAVLKTFGAKQSPGMLSFPIQGTTLALDFSNRGDTTLRLLEGLDKIVLESNGRLYPAKDGRMSATMFQAGYGHVITQFCGQRDPALSSSFWRRVYNG